MYFNFKQTLATGIIIQPLAVLLSTYRELYQGLEIDDRGWIPGSNKDF